MRRLPPSLLRDTLATLAFLVGLSMAGSVGAPGIALAQSPAGSTDALAEALFDEGKKLLDAGKPEEACAKFEASRKIDSGLGTLLYLGECYERAERYASAWARFREAASVAQGQADSRATKATDRADKLESKLHRLAIGVGKTYPQMVVLLDGQPIPEASLGVPLPTDPGSHTIELRAPGYVTASRSVEIPKNAGESKIELPALEPAPEASKPEGPTVEQPSATAPPAPVPAVPKSSPAPVLLVSGIVVGGLGVVSLGVSGALAGVAAGKYSDADAFCEGTSCFDRQGVTLSDEARTLGNASTATFVAGIVLAAGGVTMILLQPGEENSAGQGDAAKRSAGLVVAPMPGGAAFGLRGTF